MIQTRTSPPLIFPFIFLFAVCIFFIIPNNTVNAQAQTFGPNLIANPSFESSVGGNPTNWKKGGYGTNTRTFSYPVAGNTANGTSTGASVSITSYTNGDAKWYFDEVPVTPGTQYEFSNYSLSDVSTRIGIRYTLSDGTFSYLPSVSIGSSAAFQKNSFQFTVPPNVVSLTAFHVLYSVGTLTVDDYALQEITETNPGVPPNGSLEIAGSDENQSNNPAHWIRGRWGTNTTTFTYPTAGVNCAGCGSKAATVQITSYTSGDAKWSFNPISLAPGMYEYSDQYISNTTSYLTVQYHYALGGFSYENIAVLPPTASFTLVSKKFPVPEGVADITVFHLIKSVGSLTIDEVRIAESNQDGIFSTGAVSLTFDDGWRSHYDTVLPKLTSAGLIGTFFIASRQLADYGFPGYITVNEVQNIAASGHEIGAHTRTHAHLASLSTSQQQNEIIGSYNDLQSMLQTMNVGSVTSFAYPFGEFNNTTHDILRNSGMTVARGSYGGNNSSATDPYILTRFPINYNTTFAQTRQAIDSAIASKQWIILVFHEVNESGSYYSTTPATFNQIIDYIDSANIRTVTIAEGRQDM